jgi:hypothetical protein
MMRGLLLYCDPNAVHVRSVSAIAGSIDCANGDGLVNFVLDEIETIEPSSTNDSGFADQTEAFPE